MFWSKKEPEAPKSVFDLMDQTASFMGKLHVLGGFGYILFGSAFVLIVAIIFELRASLEVLAAVLIPIAIGAGILATLLVMADKLIAYQFARIKLQLIVKITERMIEATIPKDREMQAVVVRENIRNILEAIATDPIAIGRSDGR